MYTKSRFARVLLGVMMAAPLVATACPRIRICGCPFAAEVYTGAEAIKCLMIMNSGDDVLKYRVVVEAQSQDWLSLDGQRPEVVGCLPPGSSGLVAVRFRASNALDCDTTDLHGGFVVHHTDPLQAPLAMAADLHIEPAQDVLVDPTVVTFGIHYDLEDFETQAVQIYNLGCEPLTVTGIQSTQLAFWLQILHLPVVVAPGGVFTFLVMFCPLERGQYVGDLRISTDDPDEPLLEIPIDGHWTCYPVREYDVIHEAKVVTEAGTWSKVKVLFRGR